MSDTLQTVRQLGAVLAVGGIVGIGRSLTGDAAERLILLTFGAVAIPLGAGLWFTKSWARVVGLCVFGLLALWNSYRLVLDGFSSFKLIILLTAACSFTLLLGWRPGQAVASNE